MFLIVGLGNPGNEYRSTRHNVGWMVLDTLLRTYDGVWKENNKCNATISTIGQGDRKIIFAKPHTFMNDSGQAVRALVDFYKIAPSKVLVIHDDKDLPLGTTRLHTNRGAAGHNGVKSIIEHLGTKDFTRLRIGITPPDTHIPDTSDFVLGHFTTDELATLNKLQPQYTEIINTFTASPDHSIRAT